MKRTAFLPVAIIALATACADTTTTPTEVARVSAAIVGPSFVAANAPTGTHLQTGAITCSVSGLTISCSTYELAGVGNANARADLNGSFAATVDCRNHGGQVVEVKAQAKSAGVSTGELEPKNGKLAVPALSSGGSTPTNSQFTASAVCPNGNWTKEVRGGTITLTSFIYTLRFVGFPPVYITITGP